MAPQIIGKRSFFLSAGMFFMLSSQGCLATRGWVTEQLSPVAGRLSQVETRLDQTEARLGTVEGKVGTALDRLDHLRLEKRLVLNLKEGTNFVRNSDALMPETKNQIDGFLSDLDTTNNKVFLVAGHTDSTGSEAYNYELGQRRAAGVARYLITRKGIDPLQVTTMSYGKSMPIADNATWEGRSKNRRVEIWVYEEAVTSSPEKMATR
jgi:outer membrane protein OmpA-like peptidoglycan-associated protein